MLILEQQQLDKQQQQQQLHKEHSMYMSNKYTRV